MLTVELLNCTLSEQVCEILVKGTRRMFWFEVFLKSQISSLFLSYQFYKTDKSIESFVVS